MTSFFPPKFIYVSNLYTQIGARTQDSKIKSCVFP